MELDTRTLIVGNLLNALLLGVLALEFAGRDPKLRGIGQWGIATLVFALGLGGLGLRGRIPDAISIILVNTLCVAALALALRSLRLFRGRETRDPLSWVLVATVFALSVVLSGPISDYRLRVTVMTIALSILLARCAWTLRDDVPEGSERSFRFTEIMLWISAAVVLLRPVATVFTASRDVMDTHALHTTTFLLYGAFVTLSTFGVLWMGNQRLQGVLEHSARYDALTDVLNRGAFLAEFEREVSRSERDGTSFGLAIFDLDHFKRVNDEYGHPAGDRALCEVVGTLRENIRRHDVIGRYGGEEFALLMPRSDKETAMGVAERVRREVERKGFAAAGRRVELTVSGGVAAYPGDGYNWDALLNAADTALYQAKMGGRNRVLASAKSGAAAKA